MSLGKNLVFFIFLLLSRLDSQATVVMVWNESYQIFKPSAEAKQEKILLTEGMELIGKTLVSVPDKHLLLLQYDDGKEVEIEGPKEVEILQMQWEKVGFLIKTNISKEDSRTLYSGLLLPEQSIINVFPNYQVLLGNPDNLQKTLKGPVSYKIKKEGFKIIGYRSSEQKDINSIYQPSAISLRLLSDLGGDLQKRRGGNLFSPREGKEASPLLPRGTLRPFQNVSFSWNPLDVKEKNIQYVLKITNQKGREFIQKVGPQSHYLVPGNYFDEGAYYRWTVGIEFIQAEKTKIRWSSSWVDFEVMSMRRFEHFQVKELNLKKRLEKRSKLDKIKDYWRLLVLYYENKLFIETLEILQILKEIDALSLKKLISILYETGIVKLELTPRQIKHCFDFDLSSLLKEYKSMAKKEEQLLIQKMFEELNLSKD